jgi:hypothetical protein
MNIKYNFLIIALILFRLVSSAQEKRGARTPWTTYEAEQMKTTGAIMGPAYDPYRVETESSGLRCVKLGRRGQYVKFTSRGKDNSMVIRYSLPDSKAGDGTHATLDIYVNGRLIRRCEISSRYAWLYGKYPFTNDPADGSPRHFYDELRVKGLRIEKGDVVRIVRGDQKEDDAEYCIVDLVDLENVAPPLTRPVNSLSVADTTFKRSNTGDDFTEAFRKCIAMAVQTGKTVWLPAGTFKITGDIILPANLTVHGAGMWYTQLVGDEALYSNADKRVRLKGNGGNIHLSDFAIVGKLTYRSDKEANDGIVGSYGTNSTISNIWIEHTKVGMWIENSQNLKITGCRMRNTMADGINFCVGMAGSTIENCTARGTGDDCFAIWPTTFLKQEFSPGHNLIIHCTGQLPFLANGAAIYGGDSNTVKACSFTDISQGSAILVSTTFPTENKDKGINNNFSGTTVIEDCDIKNSGGFDHEWDWRAAVEICVDKRSITGLEINNLNIINSLSNGVSVVAKNEADKVGVLSAAMLRNIKISRIGLGASDKYDLFISSGAHGSLTIKNSNIPQVKNESGNFTIFK